MQGIVIPEHLADQFPERFLHDLAGNAFNAPCCLCVLLAVLTTHADILAGDFNIEIKSTVQSRENQKTRFTRDTSLTENHGFKRTTTPLVSDITHKRVCKQDNAQVRDSRKHGADDSGLQSEGGPFQFSCFPNFPTPMSHFGA